MTNDKTKHQELVELLNDAGFDNGWVLSGETLVLWEHDVEPPAPLQKPPASSQK